MTRWMILTALLATVWISPTSAQNITTLGDFVRKPDSLVTEAFGPPHEVNHLESKEAVIWTYFLSGADRPDLGRGDNARAPDSLASDVSEFSLRPFEEERAGAGYKQFAFWNGRVAAVSLLRTDTEAESLYEAGLSYLQENAQWVGSAPGFESAKLTRMADNLWTVAKQTDGNDTRTIIRVGDAGYLTCDKAKQSELRRIKAEFGVDPQ